MCPMKSVLNTSRLTIMEVAANPEDEGDFRLESKGRKSFWRLDPAPNVTRWTDSHLGLLS